MSYELHCGDCLEVLKTLPDNSVDSIVTDPPAGISFMGKDWDKDKGGRDEWIKWLCEVMTEAKRVLKPGGHALVWSLPRTSHWTALALEDAGFEIRDSVQHIFGSGFPKSLDISKKIDQLHGAEREVISIGKRSNAKGNSTNKVKWERDVEYPITAPATEAAKQWQGWGSALKPAVETWWLCRKPLSEKSIAENVLKHGTGGLNIDGCRVSTKPRLTGTKNKNAKSGSGAAYLGSDGNKQIKYDLTNHTGRFPANVILDDSECVRALFPDVKSGAIKPHHNSKGLASSNHEGYKREWHKNAVNLGWNIESSSGSAARFFYCAKASPADRNDGLNNFEIKQATGGGGGIGDYLNDVNSASGKYGSEKAPAKNHHPTVKNVNLMRYLCRLITPPGGVILDCFMGSGSTGKAAMLEGFRFIGIEQNPEYLDIARARIEHALKQPKQEELF